ICGDIPMIPHASEKDLVTITEASCVAVGSIMPFSNAIGYITVLAKGFTHQSMVRRYSFPILTQTKQAPSGMNHGSAGHTHCRYSTAGNMCIGESCSVFA